MSIGPQSGISSAALVPPAPAAAAPFAVVHAAAASSAPAVPAAGAPAAVTSGAGWLFRTRLEDLNPLQYVPVVGTIYRAITGQRLDPAWRLGGAVVTGALLGGPFGVATSLMGVGLEEAFHEIVDGPPAAVASVDGAGDARAAVAGGPPAADRPDPAVRQQAVAAYAAVSGGGWYDAGSGRGGMG